MNAKEKAKAGIWLLKQAVLEFIGEHPDGVKPSEIRDELGLTCPDVSGDFKDHLAWGIHNMLFVEGLIEKRKIDNRNHFFLANQPATTM